MFGLSAKTSPRDPRFQISHDVVLLAVGCRVLRLRCTGAYNHAGDNIRDAGAKLLRETSAAAVLLDLSQLHYTSGDDLLMAFDIPWFAGMDEGFPLAVVTGPDCLPEIQTLLQQEGGFTNWRDADFVFETEAVALEWLSRVHSTGGTRR